MGIAYESILKATVVCFSLGGFPITAFGSRVTENTVKQRCRSSSDDVLPALAVVLNRKIAEVLDSDRDGLKHKEAYDFGTHSSFF